MKREVTTKPVRYVITPTFTGTIQGSHAYRVANEKVVSYIASAATRDLMAKLGRLPGHEGFGGEE